jgi:hypothetical protein
MHAHTLLSFNLTGENLHRACTSGKHGEGVNKVSRALSWRLAYNSPLPPSPPHVICCRCSSTGKMSEIALKSIWAIQTLSLPTCTWYWCELVSREIKPVDTFPSPYKCIQMQGITNPGQDVSPLEIQCTQTMASFYIDLVYLIMTRHMSGLSMTLSSIRFDIHRFLVSNPIWGLIQQMLWMLVIALAARIEKAASEGDVTSGRA